MDKVGLELTLLSKFVLACQSRRMADAAAQLDQTPAALSMALRRLEERLGLKLFERRGSGLQLRPSAFWLFRAACHLLYLEQHVREGRGNAGRRLVKLSVGLDLNFAMGRISKALFRTCQELIPLHPELLVEWRFEGVDDAGMGDPVGLATSEIFPQSGGRVRIHYGAPGQPVSEGTIHLYDDPWVVVMANGADMALGADSDRLTILRLRKELTKAIAAHAYEHGFTARLHMLETDPAQLADLLIDAPHLRLLLPASLMPQRLGLFQHSSAIFDPPLVSPLYGEASGGLADYAQLFLATLRRNLAAEKSVAFAPRLNAQQIHYFNLAAQTGSISAAARVANTAQSSVSRRLTQMEAAMGAPLLHRTEEGAELSAMGAGIRVFTANMEAQQDWIIRKSRDIAAHSEARVTIGTLPSSGHDSALTEKIAHVVTRIHARHPDWQLKVLESSNTALHEMVRAGDLNLAVVGVVNAQVARIRLGPSEPLSVIGNRSMDFGGRKVLGLEDVCALPLVLGKRHLSIHQSFAEAARAKSLHLRPVIEVGSLALAIAMVRQAPLCTILPASSVRQDIEAGNLIAVPINQDELSGGLSVIFSAERSLSEAERTIVQEFVRVFRPGRGSDGLDL